MKSPSRIGTAHPRAGFTLLEVMVALAILGAAVAASLGLLASGTSVTQRATTRVLAVELAEHRMESLLLLDADARAELDGSRGRFDAPGEDFEWEVEIGPGPAGTQQVAVIVLGEPDSVRLVTLARP